MENEKKNNSLKIVVVILVIICLCLVGYIVLDKKNNSGNQSEHPVVNPDTNPEGNQTISPESTKPLYAGYYEYSFTEEFDEGEDGIDTETYTYYLALRDDNTYVLNTNVYGNNEPTAGTYSVDNGNIILSQTVEYGSDECFVKYARKIDAIINDNNSLTISVDDDTTITLTKVEGHDYSFADISSNPIDGVNGRKDCTIVKK